MVIIPLSLQESIDKQYLRQTIYASDFELFKINLKIYLSHITRNVNDEAHLKTHATNFLRDTWYKDRYLINPLGEKDLAVHLGKSANDKTGIIVETKSMTNKNEMLTLQKPNCKALHELILYYFNERIVHKNHELKHLIITNFNEWYIINVNEFDSKIYNNTTLRNLFETKIRDCKSNPWFYENLKDRLDSLTTLSLRASYFEIKTFEKLLASNKSKDEALLISLYKILNPTHLLKLSILNDSNSLQPRFYEELLHIIGLREVTHGSKNLIQRKEEKKRDKGSLLESTIIELENSEKIMRLSNPAHFGESYEDRLFNVALELVITWINRIIFLKLLEAQLINYHRGAVDFIFLNKERIKDFDELNILFFNVLGVKNEERVSDVKVKYAKIPYLNSALFDRTDLEHQTIFINSLNNDISLPIFHASILKAGKNAPSTLNTLDYIFDFLNAYNFSSTSPKRIQEDKRVLINAAVLGLIFEKINGYKDGSFFTPGTITMYMCRETITQAVLNKFNLKKGWSCNSLDDLYNSIEDKVEANQIINSIRICDPAVGSGHFLVSALNELIFIKHKLNVLFDRNGRLLKEYNFDIINDELIISDENNEYFKYSPGLTESQRVQEAIFHEKENIIENCLFGVDLNPNSVKICGLRLWIELLKNAYYRSEADSEGVKVLETLPNIDINIKEGNTLISRFPLNSDLKQAFTTTKWTLNDYKRAVGEYKEESNKLEKDRLRAVIKDIKQNFATKFSNNLPVAKDLNKYYGQLINLETANIDLFGNRLSKVAIAQERKRLELLIQQKKKEKDAIEGNKIFLNSLEWRFEFPEVLNDEGEFDGFDVIIGNPPYIYNRDLEENQRAFYKEKYSSAEDLYVYFTYESLKLLNKKGGLLSFITPNTYFTLSTRTKFRKALLNYSNLKFTYSGYCFSDAYVETMIFSLMKKEAHGSKEIIFVTKPNDYKRYEILKESANTYSHSLFHRLFIPGEVNKTINSRINTELYKISVSYAHLLAGKAKKHDLQIHSSRLKAGDITFLGLISVGEQGLVTGNNSKYLGVVCTSAAELGTIDEGFVNAFNKFSDLKITLDDFRMNKSKYYAEAEKLKKNKKKVDLFGKFFLYKSIFIDEVKNYGELTESEKLEGGEENLWIFYNRGNEEGYKWFVPYKQCILWSKESVKELSEGKVTNSRWQGSKYYSVTGFGWVDYFTDRIKAFFVEEGVYSKNIVKMHSINSLVSDKFIVALLNSKFISYYIKNFITTTHTLQINDGRLIPIVIPTPEVKTIVENLVDKILFLKKNAIAADTLSLEAQLDAIVYTLFALTKSEIQDIEDFLK